MQSVARQRMRQAGLLVCGLGVAGLAWAVAGGTPGPSAEGAPVLSQGPAWASQGTQLRSQDWSVEHGRLRPGKALRARFDHFLPVGRGVSLVDVRVALERQALPVLGPQLTAEVLAVWDGYARLQTHAWRHPWVERQPQGWVAALAEQKRVRTALLGEAWAQAFFGDEEARQGQMIQAEHGLSTDDSDWLVRSRAAQRHWEELQGDASLHEGERLLRMRHYLQGQHSAPEIERLSRKLDLP